METRVFPINDKEFWFYYSNKENGYIQMRINSNNILEIDIDKNLSDNIIEHFDFLKGISFFKNCKGIKIADK